MGSRYGELALETSDLYEQNYRTEKDAIRKALGDDMVYMHPVTNQYDPYAVAVFNCEMKRIGYVWMYQAPAMRCWLERNNQDYVRAFITEANPVAKVLMATTEEPFDLPVVPRTSKNINRNWADNLPEVLTNPNESLSFGLSLLLDELKVATPWTDRLQRRIDNLLEYIQIDFSAYRYEDFMTVFWMMRASKSEQVRIQSDYLLNALINRASKEHMGWWTNNWLPYFFRKAADSDLLALFEAAHYSLEHVESLLDYSPENLYYLYKVSPLRFANKLFYSALPLKIYNRLLTLMAVREVMVKGVNLGKKEKAIGVYPTMAEMASACEKTREESLWWGNTSWSVVYRVYVMLGFKGSEPAFIEEVGKWPFKKPFPYDCNKDSVGKPLRRGKIVGPIEKWAGEGAHPREIKLGERLLALLTKKSRDMN